MRVMFAEIAVENLTYSIDKPYSYAVPEEFENRIFVSQRVMIPFGNSNKPRIGIVVGLTEEKPDAKKIKKISELIDDEKLISDEMLELAKWMSERYFCTVFDCVKAMLPCGINYKLNPCYCVNKEINDITSLNDEEKQIFNFLKEIDAFVSKDKILSGLGFSSDCDILDKMVKKGFLERNYDAHRNIGDASEKMIRLRDDYLSVIESNKLTQKQKSVVDLLCEVMTASVKEVCMLLGITTAVCKALENKGVCEIYDRPVMRTPVEYGETENDDIELSIHQKEVFEDIKNLYFEQKNGDIALLFGVTGSGKTQVYLKVIDEVINDNKSVIVMVPEISLTPQTISIFKKRYGKKIAVFHSALSMGERVDEFKRVKNGEAVIAIGTRSAIFAPFENLGLIIMDEEQEHTYKSENKPRYHAREVAKFRCAKNGALLLLASATPSIESFANAKNGKYKLFELSERYGNAVLPEVICVNLNEEDSGGEKSFVSKKLLEELNKNIENDEQSIILLNRRGYNTFVVCKKCSNVVTCPNCSISMTYHSVSNKLMCHYCGYISHMVEKCSSCGSENIRYSGVGTQKIEADLKAMIPNAKILRIDADTTSTRRAFEDKFEDFKQNKYNIMIGTQMVAKGLDFENVTLVGVISADQQLYNDDYRSTERTFSLLTQVIGRCGRGDKKGRALIQTYTPDNETIIFSENQDYRAFYDYEIKIRKMMVYPPYCDLCVIGFVGDEETKTKTASYAFFSLLKKKLDDEYNGIKIIALGPVPLKVAKVGNKYRYRLILKCRNNKEFRKMISELLNEYSNNKLFSDVSAYADVNPENLL